MDKRPPLYVSMGRLFSRAECERLIAESDDAGWHKGTVVDGAPVRDSDVRTIADPASEWVQRAAAIAELAAPILDVDIDASLLTYLQIGRYAPGQYYDWHIDHDTTREHLPYDRKVSVVASLTDGGGLEFDEVGDFQLNAGDCLAFSGILRHRAPVRTHLRHTLVAWIPGPRWR